MSGFTSRNELLASRLPRFTRALHGVEKGSVNAIHRTRVASRRLREVLPVLQLDSDVSSKLSKKLRKVTRRLGSVRELDVLLILIDQLRESGRHPSRALTLVKVNVAQARQRMSAELTAKGMSEHLRRAARKLGRVLDALQSSEDTAAQARAMRWAVDARIARRAAALRTAIGEAGQVYLAERLHAVRITMKKLRYGVELAAEAGGRQDQSDLRALKRGQELLGRMHDLQVLIDRVRLVQGDLTPPNLVVWRELDTLVTVLEEGCRRLHGRYMRERPALVALCDRLRTKTQSAGALLDRRTG
ncbi:MAG: CHAD domain-containing protein [Luteitalea sp.]|nr:CHAD domain-containing protein [Luteitalea sp.]